MAASAPEGLWHPTYELSQGGGRCQRDFGSSTLSYLSVSAGILGESVFVERTEEASSGWVSVGAASGSFWEPRRSSSALAQSPKPPPKIALRARRTRPW